MSRAARRVPRYHRSVNSAFRLGDILANAITHGFGAGLAIAAGAWLVIVSTRATAWHVVSCSIFAATLILVYVFSTLYHSLVRTRARHVFRVLDHSAIYLLIAGTYTPFALVSLRGPWGWSIFGIEWGLAAAGVVFKSLAVDRFAVLSTLVYLLQGWLAVIAIHPLLHAVGSHAVAWLFAGGLAYTAGVLFFVMDRRRYFHALWHVFVLAGSTAHYCAILFYVAGPRA